MEKKELQRLYNQLREQHTIAIKMINQLKAEKEDAYFSGWKVGYGKAIEDIPKWRNNNE